ncbi:MAG TPA: Wzz/FepE/Etk N-terminal domain-containing protein [Fibrobacteraceae bacterium]|nr:Wzz/FepE/Etk N-terminal domain-containing protein [Fibrobacteraceae bacterium]
MDNPSLTELFLRVVNNTLKHFKLAAFIVVVPTIIVFILVVWVIKPTYSSNAIVTPPSSQSSMGNISGLLGSGMGAMGSLLGFSSNDDDANAVWTILNSWEIHNQVIEQFDLVNHYEFDGKFHADLLKTFRKNFSLSANDENMFEITIKDKDYKKATRMVEFVLQKADSAFNYFKTTQARLSREYFESRIALCLHDIDSLQQEFIAFQKDNNFYEPTAQIEGTLTYLGQIQILKEEVNIERSYEKLRRGEDSKKYDELTKRSRTIDQSLNKVLSGKQENVGLLSLKKTPDLVAKYLRMEEEIKVQVALYKVLRQQSEQLRIEEAKTLKNLHVLQPPWENDKKISPRRGLILIFTVFVFTFIALIIGNFLSFVENERQRESHFATEWNKFLKYICFWHK